MRYLALIAVLFLVTACGVKTQEATFKAPVVVVETEESSEEGEEATEEVVEGEESAAEETAEEVTEEVAQ